MQEILSPELFPTQLYRGQTNYFKKQHREFEHENPEKVHQEIVDAESRP